MIKTSLARFTRRLHTGLLAVLMAVPAVPVTAAAPVVTAAAPQPAWVCSQLDQPENYSNQSYLFIRKGKDDWLFRDSTDFVIPAPVTDAGVSSFSRLKRQLDKSNVRLVVFIAPPRGAMMRDHIDPTVPRAQRFSPDIALNSYQLTLQRLAKTGILVPDVLSVTRDPRVALPDQASQYYLAADQHWTAYGGYTTAVALARTMSKNAAYAKLPRAEFTTTLGTPKELGQIYRREASAICKVPYKPEMRRAFVTTQAGDSGGLLGGGGVEVALVGTSFSTINGANFSGFLRQELHADVVNYAIAGGGFESSILSYLLSDDFAQSKPKFLVWEMQNHNLKETASFPMILGAAEGDCGKSALVSSKPVPVKLGQTPVVAFDGGQRSKIKGAANLVVNLTSPDARRYHVYARYTDGRQDRFDIDASRWTHPAKKMIIRLPRDGGDLAGVSLVPDQRLSGTVSAHVCRASA